MTKRVSVCECAGSGIVMETGSPKTVAASSKLTPCLARFVPAVCLDVKILAETYCLWPSAAYYLHSIFDESK
jgi:hypothetical protein